jgi:methyl-accepting chemotaxis protein
MKSHRYDVYGAVAGVGLPVLGTALEALRETGSLAPSALMAAVSSQPLIWIMASAPFFLAGLGLIIARQTSKVGEQGAEIVRLEAARREALTRTASELIHAAQGLLGNVSAFTSTTAETAASVRETTATMTHLSQTATAAALTAETVIGLAEQAERTAERELKHAETSSAELVQLADEVRGLSTKIETLNARMRDIFEISGVMAYASDRAQKLAEEVGREAQRAGPAAPGLRGLAVQMGRHAEETRKSAQQVKGNLAEMHKAMLSAMAAAEVGGQRAEAGAQVASRTGDTIRNLANALRDAARAARDIARVAQQQENGIEQVLKAMNEIYLATEDTVASTHQVAQEAKSLNQLASHLKTSTGR